MEKLLLFFYVVELAKRTLREIITENLGGCALKIPVEL
tara:strand:+ start:217 stop:330 length:114 start_codon:yes stop_codon:yes gene_type:complete